MKKNIIKYVGFLLIAALLILCDQLTKQWAVNTLKNAADIILIPGVLELHYLENFGMAFGMMQNGQIFFYIMTVIIMGFEIFMLTRVPMNKRFLPLLVIMSIVAGGAFGNLIDRVVTKYVVDFIYFSLINFPIFNVADICVTCGCLALIILLCFVYKDEELRALLPIKKKEDK